MLNSKLKRKVAETHFNYMCFGTALGSLVGKKFDILFLKRTLILFSWSLKNVL